MYFFLYKYPTNVVYYLESDSSFEERKNILNSAFGENNCVLEHNDYYCANNSINVRILGDGSLHVVSGGIACYFEGCINSVE